MQDTGSKSATIYAELTLRSPTGKVVPFYSTSLFVPHGKEATEDALVTPAQWFADAGRYEITIKAKGVRSATSLAFDVTAPNVVLPIFEDVTAAAGVDTTVPSPGCGQFANGAAWADVDGDGNLDLFVTRLGAPTQLFMNDGAGHFTEQAAARGIAIKDANGAAFADYDNNGTEDLVIVRDGSDLLFRNDGRGHFTDVSAAAGIGDANRRGMSAAWGDYDGDGHLDLYITSYMHCTGNWSTEAEIVAQVAYDPDTLYHNNGDGTFSDVTSLLDGDPSQPDHGRTTGAGFSAAWFDYNGDGRPDLYLANDFVGPGPDHNRLWRNDGPSPAGGWKFTDVSVDSGTALFMNTMGIGVADVSRTGHLDLALSNIAGNKLMRNDGHGVFVEDTVSGLERKNQKASYSSITWGVGFYDFNLDGWEDVYFGAGNFQQAPNIPVGVQPNELFANDGTGKSFLDVSAGSGADDPGNTKGVAFADYDHDGRVDMFVVNQGGQPHLLHNVTPYGSYHWLEVNTVGTTSNRDGCGALVTLTLDHGSMEREVMCGSGGSGSANQRAVHFGLGTADTVHQIDIAWPTGRHQQVSDVKADQILTLEEPRA